MEPNRTIINRTSCCGIRELYRISAMTPENIVYSVGYYIQEGETIDGAHFVFSDNTGEDNEYGGRLKRYIEEQGLGTVVQTPFAFNPNSNNQLRAYLWTLDREALATWTETKQREEEEREAQERINQLEEAGFAIGDFVRFSENSPNHFTGRGRFVSQRGENIRIERQNGMVVNILAEELSRLTKTRPFTVRDNVPHF